MDRQDFMDIVYSELASDPDNNRANRIIWAADGYAERRVNDALQTIEELQPAQLGTNLAEVGTRAVRGYPIDAHALMERVAEEYGERARDRLYQIIRYMPPAQPEPNYDEWCTDCKEYDHENSCCHRWTKVIRQTRRELQDEFVMTAVDGTLWVTVDDVQKVGRVIVDEDKSKFCRQFYMDAQPEQRWIPVTERLPEKQTKVLVVDFGEVDTAYINSEGRWMDFNGDKLKDVKAWMPLPKWEEGAE